MLACGPLTGYTVEKAVADWLDEGLPGNLHRHKQLPATTRNGQSGHPGLRGLSMKIPQRRPELDRAIYAVTGQQRRQPLGSTASGSDDQGLGQGVSRGQRTARIWKMCCMTTTTTPQVRFRTIDGVRIRYADSGAPQEPTVVLTSPWPESVYAFAPMWASLAEHARLFAVDLPGFGASERREDLLSPRAMGEFLARLIAEAELGMPHIIAPDVGTSAALFAAAAHPDRIASMIVGTGGAAVPIQLGQPLASWVLDPDLDKYRRMDPQVIVGAAVDTIAGGIPDDIRADYLACYDGDRFAESMRYVRRYPQELPVLAGLLPQITVPVTIINGRHDRVVPLANAEFLDQRLPTSRLVIIDAGHFVWEEAPAKYASTVLDSITGNWP